MSFISQIFAAELQPNSDFLISYLSRILIALFLINLILFTIILIYPLAPLAVLFCGLLLSYLFMKITSRAEKTGLSQIEAKFNIDYPIVLTFLFLVILPVMGLNYFSTIHLYNGSELARTWIWNVVNSNKIYLDFVKDLNIYEQIFHEKVWSYISNDKASPALFIVTFNIFIGLSSLAALLLSSGKIYEAWKTKNHQKTVLDKGIIAGVLIFCFILVTFSIFSGYSDNRNFGNSLNQEGFFVNLLILSSAPFIALYQLIACLGIFGSMLNTSQKTA